MANAVDIKIIEGGFLGARNLIFTVFLQSDGASGELNRYTIMDPVSLGLTSKARFSLYKIDYNLAGFNAVVEFDSGGLEATRKWVLVGGTNSEHNFEKVGGIRDDSGMDGTGKVQLTTQGFLTAADVGSILFKLRMPA